MKSLVCLVIFSVIALSLAKDPKETLAELSNECKAESGVSEETLNKVKNHEDVGNDPKLKAHGVCILKKAQFFDANGEFLVDNIRAKFNEHTTNKQGVDKLINKCVVKKATPEDSAAHFFKCLYSAKAKAKQ